MKKRFFIWWDEFDRQDMPSQCMRCGKKKAIWTKYKFERSVYKGGRNYRRIRKVEIPLCSDHGGGGSFALVFISASDFDDEIGVWTLNVCEEFQDALEKHRKAEVKEWKEENEDADPDDFDDSKLPPGLRTEPPMPERPKPGMGMYLFLGGIATAGLLIGLTVCCVFFGIFGTAIGLNVGLKKK
ncbi:MAG TPA: hypothetical protein VFE62_24815 [Gemmataceae bacterium]|nr:hypothetical protein [Gemmataceae bacterium]